jgi:hypothetical protein
MGEGTEMILIAHRGLINGPDPDLENKPSTIDFAIDVCGYAEVDLRYHKKSLWLGHDKPQYEIDIPWLMKRREGLWIHCKDTQALEIMYSRGNAHHYFWHEEDTMTITSEGFIWAYPGKQPILNSIAVMPEIHNDDLSKCIGVCTDYVLKYVKTLQ